PGGSSSGTDSWLNDNAVNGWYKGIVEAKKDQIGWKKNSATPPPFAAMNTAWLNNVEAKGMKSIARWSKRMDCNGAKLLQCEKIFFPINGGSHWTLLVINPQDHAIEYLDSLGGKGSRYLRHARDWLAMELGSAYHADDWSEIIDRSSRQGNMDDCGVFTCLNGLASAKGRDFTEITHARMPLARRMIAAVLLNGGFTGELQL
ncbi:cysteine proteinase, partial [Dissoconium aciculare CBS 342.82]|uniref:Cysteine proteinase n=1 Tax=Dissoconium aciculare CBS 342.82 TaxID=1314786 RepID=A0A6J3M1Q0_9PEZI